MESNQEVYARVIIYKEVILIFLEATCPDRGGRGDTKDVSDKTHRSGDKTAGSRPKVSGREKRLFDALKY